jgi:hypothetical protein
MRLPQSSSRPLFFRKIPVNIFIALAAVLVGTNAWAQQLVTSPTILTFGVLAVGQSQTEVVTLTNTGSTSVNVSEVTAVGNEYSVSGIKAPLTLAAGQSTTLKVTFAPTSAGWAPGRILFVSNASDSYYRLPLGGGGVTTEAVTSSPSSLSFGSVTVGKTMTKSIMVTNGRSSNVTLTGFSPTGSEFAITKGPSGPVTLTPGESVTVGVTFTPTAAGLAGGSILVRGPTINVPLTGTGTVATSTPPTPPTTPPPTPPPTPTVGTLSISPATLNFGSVQVGTTAKESPSLSATGGSVTVTSASISNGQFAIPGATFPMTIPSGQSVSLNVTYTPTSSGSASATLAFVNNGSTTSVSEAATGSGTMPYVTLSWSPSTSGVSGYNIYRGTAPGSYAKLNPSLDATTSYTDNSVTPGATYYYAATSVSTSGQESGYSSPITVTIP